MKKNLIFSLLSSVLLSLSFPPFKLGFLAYIAIVPFFLLLGNKNNKETIRWGFLTGLFMNIGTLWWINLVTVPGAIAAILYLPIYMIIYAVLHNFLRSRLGEKYLYWCIPFLWTGVEYLRSLGVLGFPWCSLAYTQSYFLSLIQYISITSVYGVSFWVATINVFMLLILKNFSNYKKVLIYFIALILLLIIPWIYGSLVIPDEQQTPEENVRIGLIQGNIDPYIKWSDEFVEENWRIYNELTLEAVKLKPQLIIWPETAVPDYLRISNLYLTNIRELLSKINLPLITGAPDFQYLPDQTYLTFNGVFLLTPDSRSFQIYHKVHLVPFGERVPFTETFPLLKNFLESLEMGEGNFSPGKEIVSFQVPITTQNNEIESNELRRDHIMAPVVICFESLFPELVRSFILNGADILVIITNDAWFKRSNAPYHHAQMAVFRAIENRISIARCANTGVSMFVDPYGRTLKSSSIFQKCYLIHEIPLRKETTFFMRHGNVFSVTVSLLNIVPFLVALFFRSKKTELHSAS
jgi:apolipoprotein N-acyltransferase